MGKYRIVTNGMGSYKVQEKGIFFWGDVVEEIGWGCSHFPSFSTLPEAKRYQEQLEQQDAVASAQWKVVG